MTKFSPRQILILEARIGANRTELDVLKIILTKGPIYNSIFDFLSILKSITLNTSPVPIVGDAFS